MELVPFSPHTYRTPSLTQPLMYKRTLPMTSANGKRLPPMTATITRYLPRYQPSQHSKLSAAPLPDNFTWANSKLDILKAPNQHLCGSCWAFATATALSDNFVTSKILKKNPNLSPTYILATYPQGQCGGGDPAEAVMDIAKGGIGTENCLDYSWCDPEYPPCYSQAAQNHFDTGQDLIGTMNSHIPPPQSCPQGEHHLFYDKFAKSINANYPPLDINGIPYKDFSGQYKIPQASEADVRTMEEQVKRHIISYGPVIGVFAVFQNLMDGKYLETDGVYFDDTDYGKLDHTAYEGGHAVVICGWGKKNVKGRGMVSYWHVRNSWGTDWGDNGYFKFAMYPHNKVSCFGVTTSIVDPSGNAVLSGSIITFDATKVDTKHFSGAKMIQGIDQLVEQDHSAIIKGLIAIFALGIIYFVIIKRRK